MRQANDCTEGPFEASGHSPAEGPGRGPSRHPEPNERRGFEYECDIPRWVQLYQSRRSQLTVYTITTDEKVMLTISWLSACFCCIFLDVLYFDGAVNWTFDKLSHFRWSIEA